ncbi:MAG: response regulator [Candidatus Omnitrophica bacterium]|nr:response regulator [Candidatus Omnitrophota bacterium]
MTKDRKQKILLVDDDKDMCESLADVLSLEPGYEISYTTNPLEALNIVGSTRFSLIIIDYKMPEMNGLELLKRIKKQSRDNRVFILTAFISNELIEEAKKEGAEKVMSKFIWPDEILKCIKDTIG